MRKLFITDIHGDYDGMIKLFHQAKVNPKEDQLIIGGDMIDRGKDSGKVVKHLKYWCDQYPDNVKAVIGNHEKMCGWYLNSYSRMWLNHGGYGSIDSFNNTFSEVTVLDAHLLWLQELPIYVEDDEFIYTHAGIDPYVPMTEQEHEVIWMQELEFYSFPKETVLNATGGKPIIHGHTACEYALFDGARLNGDLGSETYPIVEERGLGLFNLTDWTYWTYKSHTQKIEKRKILKL